MAEKLFKKLPDVLQTSAVKNFFDSTVEQLFSPANVEVINGYIGTQKSEDYNVQGAYIRESTANRLHYSLSPALNTINPISGESQNFTFYDEYSKTLFMGDTLGLIYPHGNFVQPNLPPPDFNKEVLFNTLDELYTLDLKYLALAHFGIHKNPYELIINAKESIDIWIDFVTNLPNAFLL